MGLSTSHLTPPPIPYRGGPNRGVLMTPKADSYQDLRESVTDRPHGRNGNHLPVPHPAVSLPARERGEHGSGRGEKSASKKERSISNQGTKERKNQWWWGGNWKEMSEKPIWAVCKPVLKNRSSGMDRKTNKKKTELGTRSLTEGKQRRPVRASHACPSAVASDFPSVTRNLRLVSNCPSDEQRHRSHTFVCACLTLFTSMDDKNTEETSFGFLDRPPPPQ